MVLVGSGWEEGGRQYLSKMQSLVRDLNLTDRVTFTGYRTDVPEVLKALDATVQASLSENLGGTIEGLLMDTPMVATRVGGLIDSVVDGETVSCSLQTIRRLSGIAASREPSVIRI